MVSSLKVMHSAHSHFFSLSSACDEPFIGAVCRPALAVVDDKPIITLFLPDVDTVIMPILVSLMPGA